MNALLNFAVKESLDPTEMIIWFDMFSNSQHDTADKPFEWWETVFMNAVKSIGNVVMVMSPWHDPIPLKRVWCIFEVYACAVTKSRFYVAMSPDEEMKFLDGLDVNPDDFQTILASVDSRKSESLLPSDKANIFNVIQKTVGFTALDRMVFATLFDWVVVELQRVIDSKTDDQLAKFYLQNSLGSLFSDHGKYQEAEKLLQTSSVGFARLLGPDSTHALKTMVQLTHIYLASDRLAEAEELGVKALEAHRKVVGPENQNTLACMGSLASVYRAQGKLEEAEPLLVNSLNIAKKTKSNEDPFVFDVMHGLASVWYSQDKDVAAEEILVQCISARRKVLGVNHPETVQSMALLALVYDAQ
ncbi:Kinesin light chain 3, partial [Rhizoclosmatium hyalinum]